MLSIIGTIRCADFIWYHDPPCATASLWLTITIFITPLGVKALVTLSVMSVMGRKLLDPIFYFVAKSSSHEAFLSIILTTVLLMSFVTQGDNETKLFFFSDPFEFSVFDFLLNTQDLEVELFQDYSVYPT